jgi:hypothetical protein
MAAAGRKLSSQFLKSGNQFITSIDVHTVTIIMLLSVVMMHQPHH